MALFDQIQAYLIALSQHVPLAWFTFLGSVVEEIIAPIPSLLVPTTAGTVAQAQGHPLVFLLFLALVGSAGKTIGATVIYFIADVFEDLVMDRLGKYIGLSHKDVEAVGQYFNGSLRDYVVLFVLRILPIMPSTPISFGAGIIKLRLRVYVIGSFVGNFVRDLFTMYLGYSGLAAIEGLRGQFDLGEKVLQVIIVLIGIALIGWLYWLRRRGKSAKWLEKVKAEQAGSASSSRNP